MVVFKLKEILCLINKSQITETRGEKKNTNTNKNVDKQPLRLFTVQMFNIIIEMCECLYRNTDLKVSL